MKAKSFVTMVVGAVSLLAGSIVQADDNRCLFQGNVVPTAEIQKHVKEMGYVDDKEFFEKAIHMDDCVYKVKVKDKAGQKWKLYFDPTSGKLIAKRADN